MALLRRAGTHLTLMDPPDQQRTTPQERRGSRGIRGTARCWRAGRAARPPSRRGAKAS